MPENNDEVTTQEGEPTEPVVETSELSIDNNTLKLTVTEGDDEKSVSVLEFSQENMKLGTGAIVSKDNIKAISFDGRDIILHGNLLVEGIVKSGPREIKESEVVVKDFLDEKLKETCCNAVEEAHMIGVGGRAIITDENGCVCASDLISTGDINCLSNIKGNVQVQIDGITKKFNSHDRLDLCFIGDGKITNNHLHYLDGSHGNIQHQLDYKQHMIDHHHRVHAHYLGTGKINDKELDCLIGTEQNIQLQLNHKQSLLSHNHRLHANYIGGGHVTDYQFNALRGVRHSIQHQLDELHDHPTFSGVPKCPDTTTDDPEAVSDIATTAWCNKALEQAKNDAISNFDKKKVMMSDEDGKITSSDVTNTELDFLKGLRESIQKQIDEKEKKITSKNKLNTLFVGNGDVTNSELSTLHGIIGNIQHQLDHKQNIIDHSHPLDPLCIGHGHIDHTHFDSLKGITSGIQHQLDCRELRFTNTHRLNPLHIGHGHVTHDHFDCLSGVKSGIQDQLDCREMRFDHTHRLNPIHIGHGHVSHQHFDCLSGVKSGIQDQLDCRELRFGHNHRLNPKHIGFGNVTHEHFDCLRGTKSCIQEQLDCRELRFDHNHRLDPTFIGSGEVTHEHFKCLRGLNCNIQERFDYLLDKPCFKSIPLAPDKYTADRQEGALTELATKAYVKHKVRGVSGYLTVPDGCGDTMVLQYEHGLLTQIFNGGANWSGRLHRERYH